MGASDGLPCRRSSRDEVSFRLIQVEVSHRPRHRLVPGLLQRFLESPRQGIVARLLGFDRLLEERLASSCFRFQDARGIVQLGLVATFRDAVTHHTTKVRVDHEDGVAAGACNFDLAFELRHELILRNAERRIQNSEFPREFSILDSALHCSYQ